MDNEIKTEQTEPRPLAKPEREEAESKDNLVTYANESGGGGEVEVTT